MLVEMPGAELVLVQRAAVDAGNLAGLVVEETAVVDGEVVLVVALMLLELGLLMLSEVLESQKDLVSLGFPLLSLSCYLWEALSLQYFPRNQNQ